MPIHIEQPQVSLPPSQRSSGYLARGRRRPQERPGRPSWGPVSLLVILVCLVTLLGGDIQQRLLATPSTPPPRLSSVVGPFAQAPLSPSQVNMLHQLPAYQSDGALATMYLSHMTLAQKLGQLFMVQYWGYSYSNDLETMIHTQDAGGVIMYGAQMNTFDQTRNDIAHMQKKAWMPLLISTDEEGGFVQRIMNIYGNQPGALQTYQTGNMANAAKLGNSITRDLQALGINSDLAPDVDVPIVNGPDQYMRTWGYTPQSVIAWGGAYLRTLQGDGEIACLKHFPGLGGATTDAHQNLPVVKRSRDQLYSTELAPFKYFVQSHNRLNNPGMIMTTDVLMPAIDPSMPAELSHTFVTDILRHEFGYNGVVITDALYMLGIAKKWSLPQAVVMAIEAGNDMILGVRDSSELGASIAALEQAIAAGGLSLARINQSAERIIALKIHYHVWSTTPELQ